MATYTVKSGDSLSKIAKNLGVSPNSITGYKSGNPNKIDIGEVLTYGGSSNQNVPFQPSINTKPVSNIPVKGSGVTAIGGAGTYDKGSISTMNSLGETNNPLFTQYQAPIPKSLPTPVVSSNTAQKKATTVIQPTLSNSQQAMADQERARQEAARAAQENQSVPVEPKPPKTAEQQILDEADAGTYHAYNSTTGEKVTLKDGEPLPSGYTNKNPIERTDVSASVVDDFGNTYKKFSDGTYGRFDPMGNFIGSNATSFNNAKMVGELRDKINQVINGTYPLNDSQKAQLEGVKSDFQKLIDRDEELNSNITGGMTIAQNLYGMGNTLTGQGVIAKTIRNGLDTIKQDQLDLSSATAKMEEAFRQDDMTLLKEQYGNYVTANESLQKNIDNINQAARTEQEKQDVRDQNFAYQQAARYPDAGILTSDTPTEVQDKILKSPSYVAKDTTGEVDPAVLSGMLEIYNKTGVIPAGMGNASVQLKKAFYAAIGGAPGIVDEAVANKAMLTGLSNAQRVQQTLVSGTRSAVGTLDKQLNLLKQYSDKVDRTGSPVIDKYLLMLKGKYAGDSDTAALQNIVKTASTEFARILAGATASIAATPVQTNKDAEDLLNANMSKSQINTIINLMRQESQFRLKSYEDTISGINNDIKNLGSSTNQNISSSSSNTNSGNGSVKLKDGSVINTSW